MLHKEMCELRLYDCNAVFQPWRLLHGSGQNHLISIKQNMGMSVFIPPPLFPMKDNIKCSILPNQDQCSVTVFGVFSAKPSTKQGIGLV